MIHRSQDSDIPHTTCRRHCRIHRDKNRRLFPARPQQTPQWTMSATARLAACGLVAMITSLLCPAAAYHRAPCTTTSIRRQFQYSECYAPSLNQSLLLSQASFVMAHDAATGYLPDPAQKDFDRAIAAYSQKKRQNNHRWNGISKDLLALYGKTQVGSVYEQLNDGARALDLRPKMYTNGTIGFHRGSLVDIPLSVVTLGGLLEDAKRWCKENPKELVIIFHSQMVHEVGYNGLSSKVYMEADDDAYTGNDDYLRQNQNYNNAQADDNENTYNDYDNNYQPYDYQDDALQQNYYQYDTYQDDALQYQDDAQQSSSSYNNNNNNNNNGYSYFYTGIAKMKEVYDNHGVPYYPCKKLGGITVQKAMQLADLTERGGKGYLMAIDRHDVYASFCGKTNRVQKQLVTCYSAHSANNDNNINSYYADPSESYLQCTDRKATGQAKLSALQTYVKASANNDPTDNSYELGPPYDTFYYPFNQIQGFWQVDASSVQAGLLQSSTLLQDNRLSQVNSEMVKMVYHGEFKAVGLFSMDNVALNGNAMFSVLRNACGQSVINETCGTALVMPQMDSSDLLLFWNVVLFVMGGALVAMVSIMLIQAFRLRRKEVREESMYVSGGPLMACSGSIMS
ncbi:hypothetical protein HJC23_006488 [Cyclotella cryptica]|uniref:Uncharacterized protein n=1 Tax=Cyclotella cryptica TaxID=29204 RepID=A0ABD3PNM1_9STRA|eukprot:CCRYP_012970-RA/>CCRYP_012970-RA protein AED:0.09 eAED:0.09 QI:0/1/0.5/1/1/1/2/130/623